MEKVILGRIQYPDCVHWSQGHTLHDYHQFPLDGHIIVNTQTEIQIITPTTSHCVPSSSWLTLNQANPHSSLMSKVPLVFASLIRFSSIVDRLLPGSRAHSLLTLRCLLFRSSVVFRAPISGPRKLDLCLVFC